MKIISIKEENALKTTAELLRNDGVVVCPTDTVYGFLADALSEKAVDKIFEIKKREKSKPLPVFVRDVEMVKSIASVNAEQEKVLNEKWPGKFTFVLKRRKDAKLYGVAEDTIALRIPKYKFLNDLLEKINKPLVQTSANISGEPPLERVEEIIEQFKNQKSKPDLIIDEGDLPKSKPSTIIDLTEDDIKILRK